MGALGLGRHTQRGTLEMPPLTWVMIFVGMDGPPSHPTQGGLLSLAIDFCCPEPQATGAPTLLLDHSRLWPQPGAD